MEMLNLITKLMKSDLEPRVDIPIADEPMIYSDVKKLAKEYQVSIVLLGWVSIIMTTSIAKCVANWGIDIMSPPEFSGDYWLACPEFEFG